MVHSGRGKLGKEGERGGGGGKKKGLKLKEIEERVEGKKMKNKRKVEGIKR